MAVELYNCRKAFILTTILCTILSILASIIALIGDHWVTIRGPNSKVSFGPRFRSRRHLDLNICTSNTRSRHQDPGSYLVRKEKTTELTNRKFCWGETDQSTLTLNVRQVPSRYLDPDLLEILSVEIVAHSRVIYQTTYHISGGSKGGARDAWPPPLLAQNFFIFMQFSGKIGQIIGWRPSLGLAPPALGNPGSATAYYWNSFN